MQQQATQHPAPQCAAWQDTCWQETAHADMAHLHNKAAQGLAVDGDVKEDLAVSVACT